MPPLQAEYLFLSKIHGTKDVFQIWEIFRFCNTENLKCSEIQELTIQKISDFEVVGITRLGPRKLGI